MGEAQVPRGTRRTATVLEDWLAWLPDEKDRLFDATTAELEISYVILSVALNDAFTLCHRGKLAPAREEATIFADLFARLSSRLRTVLRIVAEHGRQFGTLPKVLPLCADFFRSEQAQQVARANQLASLVVFRARTRCFRKLDALAETVAVLERDTRIIARGIAEGNTISLPEQWTKLEVLHYDLNTCLRETMIVLKSFFCILPNEELAAFRKRLLAAFPIMFPVRPRQTVQASRPQHPVRRKVAAAVGCSDSSPGRERPMRRNNANNKDNLGGKGRIPFSRMRPDGTGGPNETN